MKRIIARVLIMVMLFTGVFMASTIQAEALSKNQTFYKELDKKDIDHKGAVRLAKSFCSYADRHNVKSSIIKYIIQSDNRDAGSIVGAGVPVYCPRHMPAIISLYKKSNN